jgi:hypothetical protein
MAAAGPLQSMRLCKARSTVPMEVPSASAMSRMHIVFSSSLIAFHVSGTEAHSKAANNV